MRFHKISNISHNNKLDSLKHDALISALKFNTLFPVTPAILPSLYFCDARLKSKYHTYLCYYKKYPTHL